MSSAVAAHETRGNPLLSVARRDCLSWLSVSAHFRVVVLYVMTTAFLHAQEEVSRPIENLISPPSLFSAEGALSVPYAPLPAFDKISGKVIGEVQADLWPCPPKDGDTVCGYPFAWFFVRQGGARVELATQEVSYEQGALVSYRPAVVQGGFAWSKIEFDGGDFWIKTRTKHVTQFEKLASEIHDFDMWCTRPGQCEPPSSGMREELQRMMDGKYELSSCGPQTYQIVALVEERGQRYYKVRLTPVEEGTASPKLPMTGYIPTRRKNGTHVGIFWSRGC